MLENLGYYVVIADGGIEGLKLIRQNKFDLVFLDLMMPDIYGLDVLRDIKTDKNLKKIPVILQTGIKNQKDIEEAFKLGVEGVINKPYNKQTLKNILHKVWKVCA